MVDLRAVDSGGDDDQAGYDETFCIDGEWKCGMEEFIYVDRMTDKRGYYLLVH